LPGTHSEQELPDLGEAPPIGDLRHVRSNQERRRLICREVELEDTLLEQTIPRATLVPSGDRKPGNSVRYSRVSQVRWCVIAMACLAMSAEVRALSLVS